MSRDGDQRSGRMRVNWRTNERVPDEAPGRTLVWRTYLTGSIDDIVRDWGGIDSAPHVRGDLMTAYGELLRVSGRQLFEAYHLDDRRYLALVLADTDRAVAAYVKRANMDTLLRLPSSTGRQYAGYWRTLFSK